MQSIVIRNVIELLRQTLSQFINHLRQTLSLVDPNFITVSAMWVGYYFFLHGIFIDLVPVARQSDHLIQYLTTLDPMIFWASVVFSVIALVITSIRSAWPVVLAWPIALVLWFFDAGEFTLQIAFGIACASSLLRFLPALRR